MKSSYRYWFFGLAMLLFAAVSPTDTIFDYNDFSDHVAAISIGDAVPIPKAVELKEPSLDAGAARYDVSSLRFTTANQTGQNWRVAADAHLHIDPGRHLKI